MNASAYLAHLNRLGVELIPQGNNIRCRALRGTLTPALVAEIKRNKEGLLRLLRPEPENSDAPSEVTSRPCGQVEFKLVTSSTEMVALAEDVRRAGCIALDTETTGLNAIQDRPRLIQIGLPDGRVHLMDLFALEDLGPVGPALEKTHVVGHNLRFDYKFLAHHLGVRCRDLFCTLTASKLINAGVPRKKGYHGLDQLLERTLGIELDKAAQTSDWSGTLTREQREYAASDVAYLLPLEEKLRQRAAELGLDEVLELENTLIPAVAEMELAGVGIDRERWEALVEVDRGRAEELREELRTSFGIENPNSHQQVKKTLNDQDGIEVENTKAETLAPYQERRIVQALTQYRTTSKFVSSVGLAVLRNLDTHGDGRVRGDLNPLAAPTGRFGCQKPPLLSLPRRPEIRACVIPAPGYVFINADYSASQLRVLAAVTKDPRLTGAFDAGSDPHRLTASLVLGVAEEDIDGDTRKKAKPVNFGFVFGMGIDRFIRYARAEFGVEFTPEEARQYKAAYLASYRGIASWHARMRREMPLEIRTRGGRLRRFKNRRKGYCQRLATPIQGTEADGMKYALVLLHRRLPALGGRLVLPIHDEVLAEVPEEKAEEGKELVVATMIEGMARYVLEIPIVVDAEIKRSWAGE